MSSKLLNYPAASANPHLSGGGGGGGAGGGAGSTGGGSSTAGSGRNALAASSSHSAAAAQLNLENLQLDDILCTVCQSVLVEPVFLPCQHRFCRNCLSGTIEKNNLNCPCCRKRFGTWYRNASRVNKLVHEQLWSAIQRQFREYLEEGDGGVAPNGAGRCNGSNGTGTVANCFVQQSEIHLSEPGEIRKEYENELQRYRKELIEEKKKELAASEKYIINLYKQEGIIDLVDSSDHLSISSSTSTPEPPAPDVTSSSEKSQPDKPAVTAAAATTTTTTTDNSKTTTDDNIHEVDDDEEAGPSGSSFPTSTTGSNHQSKDTATASTSQTAAAARSGTSKSISNGSIISISSTSSASAASSSCISSASSRYSLIKSVAQQIGRGTDIIKQKVQASILNKLTPGGSGGAAAKKSFSMADLNKSELCVKPTKLHRSWASTSKATTSQAAAAATAGEDNDENCDDDDADDSDSLRSELNHFKPIIATTPKSCFSPKAIVRVPSVRPETGTTLLPSNKVNLSPGKSPFKPIDPTTPRRSAFSVVNVHLFTPPTPASQKPTKAVAKNSGKKATPPASGSSSKRKKSAAAKSSGKKKPQPKAAASRRKRKLKFSPQPSAKVKSNVAPKPVVKQEAAEEAMPSRVTRRSFNREADRLKELIVNDQQRREAMIEQERRDFEFAQKLQKKLNRTRGAAGVTLVVPEVPKNRYQQQHPVQTQQQHQSLVAITTRRHSISAYSLRRKTVMVMAAAPRTPEPTTAGSSGVQQEMVTRKRKTMAVQRLPAVPEEVMAPPKQPAANKRKGQPPKATSKKSSAVSEPEAPPPAKVLRRSTRTRH